MLVFHKSWPLFKNVKCSSQCLYQAYFYQLALCMYGWMSWSGLEGCRPASVVPVNMCRGKDIQNNCKPLNNNDVIFCLLILLQSVFPGESTVAINSLMEHRSPTLV